MPAWAITIENPIAARNFPDLIKSLASALLVVALPLATAAIIFAGFKMIVASMSGNSSAMAEAKKMLGWILAGTAIVVGSSVLAQVAVNFAKTLE